MQKFDPSNHINNLIDDPYFEKLIVVRSMVAKSIDAYFQTIEAPRVDLYMVSGSVSSPMGKGSDSEPWPIKMGEQETHLIDSAQFGMEPLVQKRFDAVYCYLPSFRGETPDIHHLNQFYHCEAELKGTLEDALNIAGALMGKIFLDITNKNLSKLIDADRLEQLHKIVSKTVQRLTFAEAVSILDNDQRYIESNPYGRRITRAGEHELSRRCFKNESAFWITHFDRDIVPFYQKPDPTNPNAVLNADLILPVVCGTGFGGEVLGAGQRQNSVDEMNESMQRQAVFNASSYEWYLKLRERPDYQTTSGFGLGIERLISWIMGTSDIASAAIYPVMNNTRTEY